MPVKATPRFYILIFTISIILGVFFVASFRNQAIGVRDPHFSINKPPGRTSAPAKQTVGSSIMPKLGNETAKAELGRAAWKYFHSVMARFPDKPTQEESTVLSDYIHLFQRTYPCGECADHFGAIMKEFPPQVSSRSAAATWACHAHNEVNKSLQKEEFDCANIGDFYDCGCADDDEKKQNGTTTAMMATTASLAIE